MGRHAGTQKCLGGTPGVGKKNPVLVCPTFCFFKNIAACSSGIYVLWLLFVCFSLKRRVFVPDGDPWQTVTSQQSFGTRSFSEAPTYMTTASFHQFIESLGKSRAGSSNRFLFTKPPHFWLLGIFHWLVDKGGYHGTERECVTFFYIIFYFLFLCLAFLF